MSDVVDVDPDVLDRHAAEVRTLMGQLQGATAQAGDTFDVQAYGMALVGCAQVLQVWVQAAAGCIQAAVSAGDCVADAVSGMAEHYRENEKQQQSSFERIHGSLAGGPR